MDIKIHILFPVKETPTGGGNQFLKALRNYFLEKEIYEYNVEKADIILFNSYQFMDEVIKIKKKYPDKIFVHRIDGPIRLYNTMKDKRDYITNFSNFYIADGTIFQSLWSQEYNYKLGLKKNYSEKVIYNAPDKTIFFPTKIEYNNKNKLKICITSWSSNIKKGFNTYLWLDQNLNFKDYEVTFIGNLPTNMHFKNIKVIKPLQSSKLAEELKKNHIFLTASENDPCSNSLIEAIQSGLVCLVYKSGGHPELIKNYGEIYQTKEELLVKLDYIRDNFNSYNFTRNFYTMEKIGNEYYEYLKELKNKIKKSKKVNIFQLLLLKLIYKLWS